MDTLQTLTIRVKSLVPEVDYGLRTQLQQIALHAATYPIGILLAMSRLSLQLVEKIYACAGHRCPSENLYSCIVTAASGDGGKTPGLHFLPDEMASYLHALRTLSNKADHGGEMVTLTREDAENALGIYLRLLEWFYTEYDRGLRLKTIYFTTETESMLGHEVSSSSLVPAIIPALPSEETPGSAEALWNVPYDQNSFFVGRQQVLEELRRTLTITGKAALCGLGGIGKTQTVIEYAHRHRQDYAAVLWTGADTETALVTGYIDLAKLLELPEWRESDQSKAVRAVKSWLEEHDGWLLVFDNADRPQIVRPFQPKNSRGHILFTSRAHLLQSVGVNSPVELEQLTRGEAIDFLHTRADRTQSDPEETAAADQLVIELGYLPLALEQAGAYLTANQSRFQDYLKGYRKRRLGVLYPPVAGEYPDSVATTWAINFAEVEQKPAAADLLRFSSFLSPDAIPLELIGKGAKELGPVLAAALDQIDDDPLVLDEALEPLTRYSLIHRDIGSRTYSIHRIMQAVLLDGMESETRKIWAYRTVNAINAAFPTPDFGNWTLCDRLLSHAKSGVELIASEGIESEEGASLLQKVASYLWERAQYDEAEPIFQRALAAQGMVFGLAHPNVAKSLEGIAALYYDQGRFNEAEPYYSQAFEIKKSQLGEQHSEMANSIYGLARLHYRQGRYDEAESLFKQSLSLRKELLGEDNSETATSYYGLGRLHYRRGRYTISERLFLRSLAIRESQLGHEHPDVALTLSGIGLLYYETGRYTEAETTFLRTIQMRETALGPEHPDMAGSFTGLSLVFLSQKRYAEMEPLVVKALTIREKMLGAWHPYIATPLYCLAALRSAQGNADEAESLFKRVLSVRERSLGPDHPAVAASLRNLAVYYRDRCDHIGAEPLFQRAMRVEERALGSSHPHLAETLEAYAILLRETDREDEADSIEKRAAAIRITPPEDQLSSPEEFL